MIYMCYLICILYGIFNAFDIYFETIVVQNKFWECSAETSPLRKQNIFVKWQLFQLIFDLNLEQHGRDLDAIFGSLLRIFVFSDP